MILNGDLKSETAHEKMPVIHRDTVRRSWSTCLPPLPATTAWSSSPRGLFPSGFSP